jgi:hypothetical protein
MDWGAPIEDGGEIDQSPRTPFRLVGASVDAPDGGFIFATLALVPAFGLIMLPSANAMWCLLTPFTLIVRGVAPMAKGKRALPAWSTVGWFFPLPWLRYADGSVVPEASPLALVGEAAQCAARRAVATSVIVRSPPLQMGEQLWGRLRCRPGASCQSSHPMAHGQIHPLNKCRVQPPRETQPL